MALSHLSFGLKQFALCCLRQVTQVHTPQTRRCRHGAGGINPQALRVRFQTHAQGIMGIEQRL